MNLNDHEYRILLKQTRSLLAEMNEHCPRWAVLSLYPAVKGGWKRGYTWNGNYRLTIYPFRYGRTSRPERVYKTYIKGGSMEKMRQAIDRAEKYGILLESEFYYLLCLYRDGINDRRFSKRVMKSVREKFPHDKARGWRFSPDAQKYMLDRAFRLMFRRGWTEEIDGIHDTAGRVFDDRAAWHDKPCWEAE